MDRHLERVFLILLLCTATAWSEGSKWSKSYYEKFSVKTYAVYPPFNARIDMEDIDYPLLHAAIFYETNRVRQNYNLPEFHYSRRLELVAIDHSRDMVEFNFFSHTSPVKGKETMAKRLQRVGIRNCYMGENLAYTSGIANEHGRSLFTPEQNGGYFSYEYKGDPIPNHTYVSLAQSVVQQWMNSPGHRANILNSNYTFLGVGGKHYLDPAFHYIDKFVVAQCFSSKNGERPAATFSQVHKK